ncbi:hypothetical protein [Streptomyces lasiicapitis]|uniref:hypothetical protein n=1 Tax=Streptomyces lasiicapitis TaxID=1923961 RepID=UPI0036B765B3
MSARDELFRRVAGAFIDEDKANALLDAYRAEVLNKAADDLMADLERQGGDATGQYAVGVKRAIFLLHRLADATEGGDPR